MGKPVWRVTLLLALLASGGAGADNRELSAVESLHRSPEELVPLLQPLLEPGEAVIPARDRLILQASPERVGALRDLIRQLDKPLHRLRITLLQGTDASAADLEARLRLSADIGPESPDKESFGVRGHLYRLEGRNTIDRIQSVQTLEGHAAVVRAGERIPVPESSFYGYGLQYRDVTTGFAVTPRLAGGEVLVEVAPWSDRPSPDQGGVIATQSAHTVVRAALGEWVEIGAVDETSGFGQDGFSGHRYSTRGQRNRIFLKVEDLDAGGR